MRHHYVLRMYEEVICYAEKIATRSSVSSFLFCRRIKMYHWHERLIMWVPSDQKNIPWKWAYLLTRNKCLISRQRKASHIGLRQGQTKGYDTNKILFSIPCTAEMCPMHESHKAKSVFLQKGWVRCLIYSISCLKLAHYCLYMSQLQSNYQVSADAARSNRGLQVRV